MLDATERKTLAWCMFAASILCLIPGDIPKGPLPLDYARQIVGRLLDHHATHGAWILCILMVAHHLWRSRKEAHSEASRQAAELSSRAPES